MKNTLATAALLFVTACATHRAPAPVDDRRPTPAPAPRPPVAQQTPVPGAPAVPPGGYYTVKRGDTLYSIALEHGIDYRELAQWNKIEDPTKIRIGQSLRVTAPEQTQEQLQQTQVSAARGSGAIEARPLEPGATAQPSQGDAAMKTSPKALRLPYSEQNLAMLSKGEPAPPARPAAQPVAVAPKPEPPKPADRDPDAIDFVWPARGKLLAGFSEPNSKGVDIGGKIGDPVVAAAQGRVMYTGTGIRGYGKLIVIKHENGFNSVYAHNREIMVKEGEQVVRGQKIAEIGNTDSDTPKLHFEIRKSGKPVDPLRYLPPG